MAISHHRLPPLSFDPDDQSPRPWLAADWLIDKNTEVILLHALGLRQGALVDWLSFDRPLKTAATIFSLEPGTRERASAAQNAASKSRPPGPHLERTSCSKSWKILELFSLTTICQTSSANQNSKALFIFPFSVLTVEMIALCNLHGTICQRDKSSIRSQ